MRPSLEKSVRFAGTPPAQRKTSTRCCLRLLVSYRPLASLTKWFFAGRV